VFAAHAPLRAQITPGGRGVGAQKRSGEPQRLASKDLRMNWARRLKRVFGIACGFDAMAVTRTAVRGAGGFKIPIRLLDVDSGAVPRVRLLIAP